MVALPGAGGLLVIHFSKAEDVSPSYKTSDAAPSNSIHHAVISDRKADVSGSD